MERLNWTALVRSIGNHRSDKAQFYKPVCVIAALDLAEAGRLDPTNIDAGAVIDRFSDYISPFLGNKGKQGLEPFWRLANDGLWTFLEDGAPLSPRQLAREKPGSVTSLLRRNYRVTIHEDLASLWHSPKERRALRDAMLLMLASDSGKDGRDLVKPLFDPAHLQQRDQWPSGAQLNAYLKALRDQLHLFDEEGSEDWPRDDDLLTKQTPPDSAKGAQPRDLVTMLPPAPDALKNVPSPVDYVWSNARISVGPNTASVPVFPFVPNEREHAERLDACRVLAEDFIAEFDRRRWQVREDYEAQVRKYLQRLPSGDGSGNILLADAAARTLRDLFEQDQSILSASFAAPLKALLQAQYSLRPFYPQIDSFYRAVKSGYLEAPLPLDAVSAVINVVIAQTPAVFDPSVSSAIGEASTSEPMQAHVVESGGGDDEAVSPPPDPLGELDAGKAHDLQTAGAINRLWEVFKTGDKARAATAGWLATYNSLREPVKLVLDWLHQFLGR